MVVMEKGKISRMDFSSKDGWIFEVEGLSGGKFFVLDREGYRKLGMKSSISKQHLDSLMVGDIVGFFT